MRINKEPLIIIISGKARTGKNTVADIICKLDIKNSIKLSYTNYLKEYAMIISSWDGSEENKPRTLLQTLGTDIIKNKIDDKLLIRRTIEDIKVLSYYFKNIIISGARRKDEIDDIKRIYKNVISINVQKKEISNKLTNLENNHITETDLDNYSSFDYVLDNNLSIDKLKEQIKIIMGDIYEKQGNSN